MSSFPACRSPTPFEQALAQSDIRHKLIPVGKPQHNGKVERSHRTLDEECLNSGSFRKPRPRGVRPQALGPLLQLPTPPLRPAVEHPTPHFPIYQSVTHV